MKKEKAEVDPRRRMEVLPASSQKPGGKLTKRDVEGLAEDVRAYQAEYADLFARREQREWAAFYMQGQLSEMPRKTVEPMVLKLKGADPAAVRAVQQFLGAGCWEDEGILHHREGLVCKDLGETDGVLVVDGSGFPKKGEHSVGVARQYCGAVGKIANSQEGVFAVYASRKGYTFVDRRLYMPEAWFDEAHEEKRKRYGVPEKLEFQTEPKLGLAMVKDIAQRGALPFQWVAADEHFGMNPDFLDGIADLGKWYFAEVPANTMVWKGQPTVMPAGPVARGRPRAGARVAPDTPAALEVRQIAAGLSSRQWRRYKIKDGSKGPIEADFAFIRATRKRGRRPGQSVWVVFRRSRDPKPELKIYLSNAPANIAHTRLVDMAGMRWPVECAFEEAKGELGMDHYETRTWRGWHHQMTMTFLAHHFLVRLQLHQKKQSGPDTGTSVLTDRLCFPARTAYASENM
jgi:SRSO17 transposase